jgi:hypothetical protein
MSQRSRSPLFELPRCEIELLLKYGLCLGDIVGKLCTTHFGVALLKKGRLQELHPERA